MFSFSIYSYFQYALPAFVLLFFVPLTWLLGTARSTWLFCENAWKCSISLLRLISKDSSQRIFRELNIIIAGKIGNYWYVRICKNIHICSLKGMMILVVDIFTTSTSFLRFSTEIKSNTEALGSGYNTMRRQIIPPQAILRWRKPNRQKFATDHDW